MPRPGQITGKIRDKSSAQQDFARMLRELVKIIGLPSCEIADQLHVARSTLSGYLSAYRLPDLKLAVSLYQAAESAAASNGGVMPFTREALEAQYRLAQIKLCAKCPAWEGALPGYDTPASSQGGSLNGPAALAAGFPAPLSSEQTPPELSQAPADLPVLHVGGDRQVKNRRQHKAARELVQHLYAGNLDSARVLLHHAGTSMPIEEIPELVRWCRALGHDEAANTLLFHAARRVMEDVLRLSRSLLAAGYYGDARLLLEACPL